MNKKKGRKKVECTKYSGGRIPIQFDKEDLEKLEMLRQKWGVTCPEVVKKIVHVYLTERGLL